MLGVHTTTALENKIKIKYIHNNKGQLHKWVVKQPKVVVKRSCKMLPK